MTTFDDNGENGDISRIYSRNPCCLCKRFWLVPFELLAAFKSDSCTGIIVKPGGNADQLVFLGTRRHDFLLADVPCIVLANPKLFNDGEHLNGFKRKISYLVTDERSNHVKGTAFVQVGNE